MIPPSNQCPIAESGVCPGGDAIIHEQDGSVSAIPGFHNFGFDWLRLAYRLGAPCLFFEKRPGQREFRSSWIWLLPRRKRNTGSGTGWPMGEPWLSGHNDS